MSNYLIKKKIWIIGAGKISIEYLKVLNNFKYEIVLITRGKKNLNKFKKYKKNIKFIDGGLANFLKKKPEQPNKVIIASNARYLFNITLSLINYGIKSILVEKPASLKLDELKRLKIIIKKNKINYCIGYNRRFYGSIIFLKKLIKKNKIRSLYFDLTEWLHTVNLNNYSKEELNKWFLCNTSHITDLAFYLIGYPRKFNYMYKDSIKWHKPILFNGHGISTKNIPFSYRGDWLSYGRWEIKLFFKGFVVNLKPLENIEIEYINKKKKYIKKFKNEKKYKHGFYQMCADFLDNNFTNFCTIDQQILNFKFIYKILGWSK